MSLGVLSSVSRVSRASLPSPPSTFRGGGQEMCCTRSVSVYVPVGCRQDGAARAPFPRGPPGEGNAIPDFAGAKSGKCLTAAFISNPHLGAAMRSGRRRWGAARVRGWRCGSGCFVPPGVAPGAPRRLSAAGPAAAPAPCAAEQDPVSLQKIPAIAEQPTPRRRPSLYKLHRQPGSHCRWAPVGTGDSSGPCEVLRGTS